MKVKDIDMDAVILGNGEYPTHSMPETMLIMAPYVVCCDGSADEHIRRGFIPNAIIGDGDSLSAENKDRFREIFHQIDDQETNDQTKAVLLVDYMKVGAQVTMLTDHGMFVPASGRNTFKSRPGQQVSVFNFGATGLRGEGLVYPLSDFDNWWQGTLNEATGDEFTIHAEGDYLVYLNY